MIQKMEKNNKEEIKKNDVVVMTRVSMVFRAMWLQGNQYVRAYLERMIEYTIGRPLGKYIIVTTEDESIA